ncbi:MAG: methyltransferase domain-containing protein [Alphaproteobacteria bacterium]|nr:methyltransferase domain-containing protein [Alphaproteobacteria bacterium]
MAHLGDHIHPTPERRRSATIDAPPPSCPLCGYHGPFRPHKRTGRPDASCGRCGARERHRLFALYLHGCGVASWAGAKVLHVSPEYFIAPFFADAALYLTADLADSGADIRADLTHLALADAAFDAMLCSHVLEHIEDDTAAIAEIHRILKPGGIALINVPLDPGLAETYEDSAIASPEGRAAHFGQFDHVRRYGMDFPRRLATAGFDVTAYRGTRGQRARHAIHDATILYLARKRR